MTSLLSLSRRLFLQASAATQVAPGGPPPNLLFLISDDHSAADLGCYGNAAVRTPNLDRFASQGTRFTRCYVTSPQCSPNRSAILTGCAPHSIATSRLHAPMPEPQWTLLEGLKERGYYTGAFRKVHQGPAFDKRWDFYGTAKEPFAAFFDKRPANRPFYLHVGFTDPHRPYKENVVVPPHDPAKVRVPEWLPDTPEVRRDLALYADAIARMDGECGEVLRLLEERGLAGNTLVLFTGDNGMPFPPRAKGTLYEDGIRVPLLARWPGRVAAGAVQEGLVSHLDLTPTWLEAAGATTPRWVQGRSFLPTLTGRAQPPRAEVFSERNWHDKFDVCRCIRTATHKLIYNGMPEKPFRPISDLEASPTWEAYTRLGREGKLVEKHRTALTATRPMLELYDLQKDPQERMNLAEAAESKELLEGLLGRLSAWQDRTNDFLPPPYREFPVGSGRRRETL